MVEVEFRMELSDYKQLLSDWLKKSGLNVLRIIKTLCIELLVMLKKQYRFLRKFNYTKENITAHLMQKAAQFFGVDLKENDSNRKRRNEPFRSRFRLNSMRSVSKNEPVPAKVVPNSRKKRKNNRMNIYHAPE